MSVRKDVVIKDVYVTKLVLRVGLDVDVLIVRMSLDLDIYQVRWTIIKWSYEITTVFDSHIILNDVDGADIASDHEQDEDNLFDEDDYLSLPVFPLSVYVCMRVYICIYLSLPHSFSVCVSLTYTVNHAGDK